MIPEDIIESWQPDAPWQTLPMIEQDLVISRALIDLYNDQTIRESLGFRGGTALHKLYIKPAARYSEDIDLVQTRAEPIGKTINAIRDALRSWLGEPKRKITDRSIKLVYQYKAVNGLPSKLKIEINTTEHFHVLPLSHKSFTVGSAWFQGTSALVTYELEELMATKLRALYQRRKGRDLFDIWTVFGQGLANIEQTLEIFQHYCTHTGTTINREMFKNNMELKRLNKDFQADMNLLLPQITPWKFDEAFEFSQTQILSKIP